MHKYLRHLGDYAKDTKHLSMLEHGAYNQMLDWCYAAEKPLPSDEKALFRLCSAFDKAEQQAVRSIRDEFFVLTQDGYTQKRVMEEIADYRDKAAKATAAAEKRWQSERNADAMRTHSDGNANGMHRARVPITDNRKPVTNDVSAVADEPQLSLVADAVPPASPPTGSDAKKKKGGRARNLLFDAMLEVCGMPLEGLTGPESGRVAAALRDIRGAMPEDITTEALIQEIRTRARRYREKWSDIDLTPTGLASNWSQFGAPQKKEGGAAVPLLTIEEPPEGHEQAMEALFGEQWREMCPGWPQMTASDKSQVRAWLREHGKEAS